MLQITRLAKQPRGEIPCFHTSQARKTTGWVLGSFWRQVGWGSRVAPAAEVSLAREPGSISAQGGGFWSPSHTAESGEFEPRSLPSQRIAVVWGYGMPRKNYCRATLQLDISKGGSWEVGQEADRLSWISAALTGTCHCFSSPPPAVAQCHSGDLLGVFGLLIPIVSAGSQGFEKRGLDLATDPSQRLP